MKHIEAAKQALEALELFCECGTMDRPIERREALRQAIEQAQQAEPVAFASHGVVNWIADKQFQHEADLYTSPQRQWVGLTNEEMLEIWDKNGWYVTLFKSVEAKLKEKNA